jgi:hypothetical protein
LIEAAAKWRSCAVLAAPQLTAIGKNRSSSMALGAAVLRAAFKRAQAAA